MTFYLDLMKHTILLLITLSVLCGCEAKPPENLGVSDGKFVPCPDSPNCVSSQSEIEKRHILPLSYSGSADSARHRLVTLIKFLPRTKVVTENDAYLHAEFTIAVLGFIDDVEFRFDDANKTIHVRSAARVGYWDLGVNRRRVEKIRKLWQGKFTTDARGTTSD